MLVSAHVVWAETTTVLVLNLRSFCLTIQRDANSYGVVEYDLK